MAKRARPRKDSLPEEKVFPLEEAYSREISQVPQGVEACSQPLTCHPKASSQATATNLSTTLMPWNRVSGQAMMEMIIWTGQVHQAREAWSPAGACGLTQT